ncbi:MAG: hypothetical protein ACFE8O_06210, partial [Candidatus Hermodarchaeota archaeon]
MKGARPFLLVLLILMPLLSPLSILGTRFNALYNPKHLLSPDPNGSIRVEGSIAISALNSGAETQCVDSSIPVTNGNSPRNWTILIYMCADNDRDIAAI